MRLASSDQGFWLLTGQCTRVIGGQRTTFPGSQGHVFPLYLRVRKAKASSVGSLYKCEPPPAFLPTEPPLSPFVYLVLWMQALGFNVFGGICDATQAKYNHGAAQSHAWGWHLLGIHNSETHDSSQSLRALTPSGRSCQVFVSCWLIWLKHSI